MISPQAGRFRPLMLIALLLCAALASSQASADELVFDWPETAEAHVTVESEKRGKTAKIAMTLKVSPAQEKGRYLLEYADVKLLEANGVDLSSPEAQAAIPAQARAMLEALPSFLVGADGAMIEIVGLDRVIDTVIYGIPDETGGTKRETLRNMMSSPQMRQLVEAKAASDWDTWVGVWVGRDLPVGKPLKFETEQPLHEVNLVSNGTMENLGPDPAFPGGVRLRTEVVTQGPELLVGAVKTMAAAISEKPGADLDAFLETIESAERTVTIEVVTDPKTLRPYRAESSMVLTARIKGREPEARREIKRFRFDWKDSAPTGGAAQ
jgi:hypothetical protein